LREWDIIKDIDGGGGVDGLSGEIMYEVVERSLKDH
jgi:hypothetical protein